MKMKIETEYIKLDQLLKFAGLSYSGSDAKDMILAGIVSVNEEPCTARGKKIYPGDRVFIAFDDEYVELVVE